MPSKDSNSFPSKAKSFSVWIGMDSFSSIKFSLWFGNPNPSMMASISRAIFDSCFEQEWIVPELLQAFVERLGAFAYVHDFLAGTLPLPQKWLDRFVLQIQEMDQHSPGDCCPFELQRETRPSRSMPFPDFGSQGHIWNKRVSTKNLIPPLRFLPIRSLFHSSRTRSTAIFERSG